jgi:hypothetical protein
MIRTRVQAGIAAGALAATALLTPAAALADSYYAQAWARVDADGTLITGQNVVSSRQIRTGVYCVRFTPEIDPATSAIQATSRHNARTITAYGPAVECGNAANTVAVTIYWLDKPTTGSFDVAVL